MDAQMQYLVVMIAYMVLLISWGIYQGRKVKSQTDYSIAGRNLPGWVAALSERAAGESSWALLGLPGAAYATGLVEIWTAVGCVAGIVCTWAILAWRLQKEADKFSILTFVDYIAKRHGDSAKWIRAIGSITIVFFFFFYVGAQFIGGGKTLFSLFGINTNTGMLIMLLVVVPYTIYGGFRSVAYTDVLQAGIMILTLIIGPVAGILYLHHHGDGLFAAHMSDAISLAGNSYSSLTGGVKGFSAGVMIIGGFSWFFGYLGGQPQLSMRFMAIRNKKQAGQARNIGIIWTVLAYIGALSIGWIGIAMFGPSGLTDQEYVMPMVIKTVFPPAIAGILITGAIAAIISTANSLLIVSSTELSENLVKPWSGENSFFVSLNGSRIITASLAVSALVLTYFLPSNLVFTIVGYVWAGVGCTFSVVILLTLFWKRFHGKAALITIITGLVFTIFWISSGLDSQIISARVMTFVVAGIVAVVSTFMIKPNRTPSHA